MTGEPAPGTTGTPDLPDLRHLPELPVSGLTSAQPPAAPRSGPAAAGSGPAAEGSSPAAPGEAAPAIPWAQLAARARTGLAPAGHGLLLLALAVPGLVLSLLVLALALPGPGLVAYALGQHHTGGAAA